MTPGTRQSLELNGSHQLLFYTADGNTRKLGEDTKTIKRTEPLCYCIKEVGLEVNAEKIKCFVLSRHQNAGQNHCLIIFNT